MKSFSAHIVIGLGLTVAHPPGAAAQDTARVAVVATTDIHGRAMHWDYVADTEAGWGLTRAAKIVDSLRHALSGAVVLVDAGGVLQGDPFATYFATGAGLRGHPVVDAMNALQYDAFTPGDRDFDFGVETFVSAMNGAAFPVLAANVYTVETNARRAFGDVTVVTRGGVEVGIAGLTNPGAMVWNASQLQGRLAIRPIVAEAEQVVRDLVTGGAELKMVVVHSGMGEPSSYDPSGVGAENVAARLAELPIKPDLVVYGHTHRPQVDLSINGVHFMQPRPWARGLAVAHVTLVRGDESRPYRVVRIASESIPLDLIAPDPGLTRRLSTPHSVVQAWVNAPLGEVTEHWSAQFARTDDVPVIDFINEVQRRTTGADLSSTRAMSTSVAFGPGRVRRGDIMGLYPDESTLMAVRIDGATLRQFLEQSAEYYRTFEAGQPIIDPARSGDDFEIVSGVEYVLDLTRPAGSRVRQMVYGGRLVRTTDSFTLALASYRQVGGGGYDMIPGLPVVYDRGERIRDLLTAEVERRGTLEAAAYSTESWRITPGAAHAAAREAFGPIRAVRDRKALRVMVTSALGGSLEPRMPSWSRGRAVGGAVALKAWMDSLEATCRCAAVRLDAGDRLSGSLISNTFFGRPMVDAANVIGYDAAAVGEGEFTWGVDTLSQRASESAYPWLAANLELAERRARPGWVEEWTMIERDGVRTAVIGITARNAVSGVLPANIAGLSFSDPASAVTDVLRTVRNAQPDYVVVVAHANATCGGDTCHGDLIDLANELAPGAVDLLVGEIHGGTVHSVVNGIHVVHAGTEGTRIGLVDFVVFPSGRREVRATVQTVWADGVPADPMLEEVLAGYRSEATRLAQRRLATLKLPLNARAGESALGRLVADAYRNAARTQIAVVTNGEILTGLPAGPVTYEQVSHVQSLSRTIVRLSLRGEVILSLLEHVLAGDAPMAQVSGMTVWYDPDRRAGDRVRRVRLSNDRELERDAVYSLAVSDFAAAGGLGIDMPASGAVERTNVFGVDAVANYLERLPQPVEITSTPRFRTDG